MVDLHSHVLPGIDDGARDLAESLALASEAAAGGVRILAATPHLRADHPPVRPPELAERCAHLNGELDAAGVELEVVSGGEVDLDWAEAASDDDLRLVSFGQRGTDLLVEIPYGPLSAAFEHRIDALADRGFRLLLAHPERNPSLRARPDRVAALAERGCHFQLTARSPTGAAGGPVREAAHDLLRRGLVHVLASDAHGAGGPAPADLRAGVAAAEELVGPARARWMATDAPAAILEGRPLPPPP